MSDIPKKRSRFHFSHEAILKIVELMETKPKGINKTDYLDEMSKIHFPNAPKDSIRQKYYRLVSTGQYMRYVNLWIANKNRTINTPPISANKVEVDEVILPKKTVQTTLPISTEGLDTLFGIKLSKIRNIVIKIELIA